MLCVSQLWSESRHRRAELLKMQGIVQNHAHKLYVTSSHTNAWLTSSLSINNIIAWEPPSYSLAKVTPLLWGSKSHTSLGLSAKKGPPPPPLPKATLSRSSCRLWRLLVVCCASVRVGLPHHRGFARLLTHYHRMT